MTDIIAIDPDILGGAPVFTHTRVPVQTLFDYIEGGDTIDDFVADFPSVNKSLVIEFLEQLKSRIVDGPQAA